MKKISIVMLTYNAPLYVKHSIMSVKKHTVGVEYELIVCDNHSGAKTKRMLEKLYKDGWIDKLFFFDKNYYFVAGNNRAMQYVAEDSAYILLLNSDIEIRNNEWLKKILDVHKRGITACQVCDEKDKRPDGWCLLVDKDIYMKNKLDEEHFTWFFSIADFGSRIMKLGYSVQSIRNYRQFIIHFGGASEINNDVAKAAIGCKAEVGNWYPHECDVLERLDLNSANEVPREVAFYVYNIACKVIKRMKNAVHSTKT